MLPLWIKLEGQKAKGQGKVEITKLEFLCLAFFPFFPTNQESFV